MFVWELDPLRAVSTEHGRIKLGDAAKIAYESVEGTLLGGFARAHTRGALWYMAHKIFYEVDIVWGKRVPSTKLSKIHTIAAHVYEFSDDCNTFKSPEGQVLWTEMAISKQEFKTALKQIQKEAAERT